MCGCLPNKSVVCRVSLLPSHQSETQQISSSDNASNRGLTLEANQCLNRLGTGTAPPTPLSYFSLPQHRSLRVKNTIKPGATEEEFGKTSPQSSKHLEGFDRCKGWFNQQHSQWLAVPINPRLQQGWGIDARTLLFGATEGFLVADVKVQSCRIRLWQCIVTTARWGGFLINSQKRLH